MKTTTVMFKTDKQLKAAAQKTAKQMGIPFSAAMNRLMQEFVARREITFSAQPPLKPTPYLARILRQQDKHAKTGKDIKVFNSLEELMADFGD
jgi:addiction module RelB/DinJ family antitoxin